MAASNVKAPGSSLHLIYRVLSLWLALLAWMATGFAQETAATRAQPNFLVILADDMGWSDLGVLGGEIRTPTIDALARRGTLMTDFYVAPTCAPTRSMLVTGVDNHQAGLGVQSGLRAENQVGINYEGQLHNGVVTVAEGLATRGYQTLMAGKWHLANDLVQAPHNRGFQQSFALLAGGASHFGDQTRLAAFEPVHYIENGQPVTTLPADWYSSIGYADKILEYLAGRDKDAPFFAYLAFTAPHDPLQVPDEWLDRYRGHYDQGPVATRRARAERQAALGLIPGEAGIWQYPRFPGWFPNHAKPWQGRSADQRAKDARPMEVYAAMVELMDQQIGRVLAYLDEQGELDNTYVIFFSDNGASSVGPMVYPGNTKRWMAENWGETYTSAGGPQSFTVLGREWASTANTPWKLYKNTVSEGGIRSPLVVAGPGVVAGEFNDALAHVTDITPTIFDLAGIEPATDPLFANKVQPQGVTLMPALRAKNSTARASFGVHLFGNRGYRRGHWKISNTGPPLGTGQWQLFDLSADPGESNDLAAQQPETLQSMLAAFDAYVEANGVILPDKSPLKASLRALYPGECNWWCATRFKIIGWLN
ncbi:MAG: arylsulfatase [Pseudomonadota bacterium]